MTRKLILLTCIPAMLWLQGYTQTASFLSGGIDEYLRRSQLMDTSFNGRSFTLRSFSRNVEAIDSLVPLQKKALFKSGSAVNGGFVPFSFESMYSTNHPYGWNDGSFIPSNGVSVKLSGGAYAKLGRLSIQLNPEMVFSENRPFEKFFTALYDTTWSRYYKWLNRSDIPERFGNSSYRKIFGGQSSIRYNWDAISLGISTENLWWGPGTRNALIMSNNAPGFLHATFNTTKPVHTSIGTFEWQVVGGLLNSSGILPPETNRRYTTGSSFLYVPKHDEQRYLSGMMLSWQPRWVKGLFLGFAKASYQYKSDISGIADILPLEGLFRSATEKSGKKASLGSVFARYIFSEEMAELYMEYGRSDKSANPYNIIADSKYPRAYVAGMRKLFPSRKGSAIEFTAEFTQMQLPAVPDLIHNAQSWYTNDFVRQGYTNMGQVIGAGIGPGSNSQTIGIAWVKGIKKIGITVERLLHNNDFYYDAFEESVDYRRHWVDLSTTVLADWSFRNFLISARMTLARSLNYQWLYIDVVPPTTPEAFFRNGYDVLNFNTAFSISYRF